MYPFLISASLASIGGTITGISINWSHLNHDEERVALVSGLVFSSLLFLVLVALRFRRRPLVTQPFLQGDVGEGNAPVAGERAMDPQSSEPLV